MLMWQLWIRLYLPDSQSVLLPPFRHNDHTIRMENRNKLTQKFFEAALQVIYLIIGLI